MNDDKERLKTMILLMTSGFLIMLMIHIVEYKETVLQEKEIKPKEVHTEKILRSMTETKNSFNFKDTGYLWIHSSVAYFTSDKYFVYYTKEADGDIVRKEIPFDFKIREDDIESAKLVTFQKRHIKKYCKGIGCGFFEKDIEEIEIEGDTYQILYIPKGTLDNEVYSYRFE
ncbi:hypothetical protein AALH75_00635 [[Clostridium] innocuum]|uniref:hypothetical protein n=1 Tax=Clostridium innocuum TaxID=1522 RepID=UPI00214783D0|nr:hypothetical protein [[Clostridium] innocuum]MCR0309043.1 hypothetical protein [[Clostridium] innocuum]MCR0309103.1 hypothetical protein [[Clostridium] innocuum]MCR0321671.1 hypothetical protein [[Clostridium] innocuum]